MKRYLFAILIVSLAACGEEKKDFAEDKGLLSPELVSNPRSAEGVDSVAFDQMPIMAFADTMHNFGNLIEGEVASHDFEFQNNGKTPLIIHSATGSCGCTVPEYPHEPVPPGGTGIIKVKFNTADKVGHQDKSVLLTTNSQRGSQLLHVRALVAESKN